MCDTMIMSKKDGGYLWKDANFMKAAKKYLIFICRGGMSFRKSTFIWIRS